MDGEDRIRALYHIWLDGLTVTPPPCAALLGALPREQGAGNRTKPSPWWEGGIRRPPASRMTDEGYPNAHPQTRKDDTT